jgi:hypothetical protein
MQGSHVVKHTALASAARDREQSGRALPLQSKLVGSLVGAAVVLACIALPLVLGQLSVSMEEDIGEARIHALYASGTVSHMALGTTVDAGQPAAGAHLLEHHYYFVNGCIASPGSCTGPHVSDWGEYYDELRRLYYEAVQNSGRTQSQAFEAWAATHTHFIMSRLAPSGADSLARALAENKESGDIHVVGTSAGGSTVISYLSQAMRGEVPMDRRIRSVITVDAPLGHKLQLDWGDVVEGLLHGFQASAMKTDVQSGLGRWAKLAGIAILTVDTEQDIVGYDPLPDVSNDPNPQYRQSEAPPMPTYPNCTSLLCEFGSLAEFLDLGSAWHMYTGSHLADSALQFIDEHWR